MNQAPAKTLQAKVVVVAQVKHVNLQLASYVASYPHYNKTRECFHCYQHM